MALRRRFTAAVLAAAVLAAITGCSGSNRTFQPTRTGTIEGYIFGYPGRSAAPDRGDNRQATPPAGTIPLNGVTIRLDPSGLQSTTGPDASGQAGYFRIAGLDPGTYTATVTCPGYHETTFSAKVTAGSIITAGTSTGQTVLAPVSGAAPKQWTVMVYMDGDNNLEEYGVLNINQMESVGSDANVNIVVQYDRGPGFDATNGDWTDTRRFLITRDNDMQTITSPMLQNLGEVDMAQPGALRDFITWATSNYPAEHYALVPWNHGGGWRLRLPSDAASRGIIFDDTSNTFMTMAQFSAGMAVPNVHLDLVAIDCSLMGMLEVAYEIKDRTDYIAASEESPPGEGYPYDRILTKLAANPSMTAESLGRVIVNEHVANYPQKAVTQSLVQTARLADLAQKVNVFGAALLANLATNRSQIDTARSYAQAYKFAYYRDIYDFARQVKTLVADPAVVNAADAVLQGVPGANGGPVIAEAHSATGVQNSHGLSIYLPAASQLYSRYGELLFCSDYPKWNAFINQLAAAPQ